MGELAVRAPGAGEVAVEIVLGRREPRGPAAAARRVSGAAGLAEGRAGHGVRGPRDRARRRRGLVARRRARHGHHRRRRDGAAITVHERELVAVPSSVSLVDAGGIPEVFWTAWDALVRQAGSAPASRS